MLKRNWALIAFVYLALAEALSLVPVPDLSLCLIQPEDSQQASDDNDQKYCPAFHTGIIASIDAVDGFLEHHDKSVVGGFTIVLAISTIGLWLATNKLWAAGEKQFGLLSDTSAAQSRDMQISIKVAADAAMAAIRSAKVAEEALIANDRAWILIKAEIIGPLTFGDGDVTLNIAFDMVNIGKSPATHVELFAALSADIIKARDDGVKAVEVIGRGLLDHGVVIFPSDTNNRELLIKLPVAEFKENIAEAAKIIAEYGTAGVPLLAVARPAIMACASYRLAGSRKERHTVILFEVRHTYEGHFGWSGDDGETGRNFLRLVQTFMSGQVT